MYYINDLNILFYFTLFTSPSESDMKSCVALSKAALRKPNMNMTPPTILNIPKSEAPRELRIRRVVYNEINIVIPIFAYRNPVFFITLLAVELIYLVICALFLLKVPSNPPHVSFPISNLPSPNQSYNLSVSYYNPPNYKPACYSNH